MKVACWGSAAAAAQSSGRLLLPCGAPVPPKGPKPGLPIPPALSEALH